MVFCCGSAAVMCGEPPAHRMDPKKTRREAPPRGNIFEVRAAGKAKPFRTSVRRSRHRFGIPCGKATVTAAYEELNFSGIYSTSSPGFLVDFAAGVGFCCGDAGDLPAGVGDAFGSPVFDVGGVVAVFAFAAGVFGVGAGFAAVFVFAGTGTRITPLSFGMNWLGLFGSMVIT